MSDVTITAGKGINQTRAFPLVIEGWMELHRERLVEDNQFLNWDDEWILAERGGVSIGVISFCAVEHAKYMLVRIGYVQAPHRQQGVYKMMWERLVHITRDRGLPLIMGATRPNNTASMAMMRHLGRYQHSITYAYDVLPIAGAASSWDKATGRGGMPVLSEPIKKGG